MKQKGMLYMKKNKGLTKAEVRKKFDKAIISMISGIMDKDSFNISIDKKDSFTKYTIKKYGYYLSINVSSSIKFSCRLYQTNYERQTYYNFNKNSDINQIIKIMKKDFKDLFKIIAKETENNTYLVGGTSNELETMLANMNEIDIIINKTE